MTAGWVAGTVRARSMARRILGAETGRQLAASTSLAAAQRLLAPTPFAGAAEPGMSLAAAQHAVAASVIWDLRVLAGWLPRDGVSLLRVLAGWFEIANADELLQAFAGRPVGPVFELGALATAWPRLRETRDRSELRQALTASAWGDPAGSDSRDIRLGMRIRWADRLKATGAVPPDWIAAMTGLLRAGPGPAEDDPWLAQAAWWRRVEYEAGAQLRSPVNGPQPVVGAVVTLAADARRVTAALACAARGGAPTEFYDAVA